MAECVTCGKFAVLYFDGVATCDPYQVRGKARKTKTRTARFFWTGLPPAAGNANRWVSCLQKIIKEKIIMYCEIHEITHESDSCPVCYLMKFLANDQKRNFYEKFPAAQQSFAADAATPCAECGSSLPIVGGKYCGNCGTPRR